MIEEFLYKNIVESTNDAVVYALWLLHSEVNLQEVNTEKLRALIQEGLDSGPATQMDFEALKARGRKRLAEERAQQH